MLITYLLYERVVRDVFKSISSSSNIQHRWDWLKILLSWVAPGQLATQLVINLLASHTICNQSFVTEKVIPFGEIGLLPKCWLVHLTLLHPGVFWGQMDPQKLVFSTVKYSLHKRTFSIIYVQQNHRYNTCLINTYSIKPWPWHQLCRYQSQRFALLGWDSLFRLHLLTVM